jgi:hypothetical protein
VELRTVNKGIAAFSKDGSPPFTGAPQVIAGVFAGFIIGIVASLLGVAGGEFLIPTLVLLFGADIKLAGSLSLAVILPTMLVGLVESKSVASMSHRVAAQR